MDSRKATIKGMAEELLSIKKQIKELNVNIRIIESEIIHSKNRIITLYHYRNGNKEKVDQYKNLEKQIKKSKKNLFRNCGIAAIVLLGITVISGFNSFVVVGTLLSYITCVGCHIAALQGRIDNQKTVSIIGKKKAKDKEDLEEKVEEENKKIRKSILQEENKKRNLEANRNDLESKKENLQNRYQNLSNQVKTMTTERYELAESLLEEYDNPVLDLNKPFYKGKRLKSSY